MRRRAAPATADAPTAGAPTVATDAVDRLLATPRWGLFCSLALFRVCDALAVSTYFNPDEYWQSLEVAHRLSFGYGVLTWEWERELRGWLHPILFAALYRALAALGVDSLAAVVYAPRVLQGLCAAATDLATFDIAERWFGRRAAAFALLCSALSWFAFFCYVRPFSNCAETLLTALALARWPFTGDSPAGVRAPRGGRRQALAFAALATVIRPTAVLPWCFLGARHLWKSSRTDAVNTVTEAVAVAAVALGLGGAVDYACYGHASFPLANFVRFNVLTGGASSYGAHPWHWYITQGLPMILGALLPIVAYGIHIARGKRAMACSALVIVGLYSLQAHKEPRFILPIAPIAATYAGHALEQMGTVAARRCLQATLVVHAPLALYFSRWHQAAPISAMWWMAERTRRLPAARFALLMPCHATPWQASVHHAALDARYLDCSPPPPPVATGAGRAAAPHETARFYADPVAWLRREYAQAPLPTHVLLFSSLREILQPWLAEKGYEPCRNFFHAHFPTDCREGRTMQVLARGKAC